MEFLDDPLTRTIYSSDASNYRIPPRGVAQPVSVNQLREVILTAFNEGIPVTMRGRGTSCAGNAIGPGLIVDVSKHCNQILDLDAEARTITVEPGVVLADIQRLSAPHSLRFGPDPSTWTRATIGGSIGNNACGPHAQAWGRVADNVIEMRVLDGYGREFTAGRGADSLDAVPGLQSLIMNNLALIREECGRFRRQVSGYSLEHLLPENGYDLAKFLVGSEGTLASVLQAKLRLVPVPRSTVLVVLGYPDMIAAGADVPLINSFRPLAVEGMDSRLVYTLAHKPNTGQIPQLPEGKAWLLVELEGNNPEEALDLAKEVAAAANTRAIAVYPAGTEATRLWRIRADGAGLGGRTPLNPDGSGNDPAWPGWEDAAVPPEHLAAYLQDFTALMRQMKVDGMLYGHLGDGCLHVRLNLPLASQAVNGKSREFLERAANLVAKHHGSLSGEHGDGRARSELLPRMFSAEMITLFRQVKALFDPRGLLNPGVLVDPEPLDANLRLASSRDFTPIPGGFSFPHDPGFAQSVHRCTGVGKCLAMKQIPGSWMCPSYLATGEEKDSTRGRARALQEVSNGGLIHDFKDPALLEALDLCLACKACSSACPTGIDMAAYRSEVFYRAYQRRPWARPRSHWLLGRLPGWLKLVRTVPGGARIGNAVFGVEWIRRTVFYLFGLEPERQMARFATRPFHKWASEHGLTGQQRPQECQLPDSTADKTVDTDVQPWVVLWADSFSEGIETDGAQATALLLQQAGYKVYVPEPVCCGLTYITTGQLGKARRNLGRLCETLGPLAVNGIPIVGVEPSCTATLRDDLPRLLPDDPRAQAIAKQTLTLAQLLTHPRLGVFSGDGSFRRGCSWRLPDLDGIEIVAQPHCHHYAVMGWDTERELLKRCGAKVIELTGCCGMAGNFGMERGHLEISRRVAQHSLVANLGDHEDAVFLADGFSCRTQARQLADCNGIHLARLLLDGNS